MPGDGSSVDWGVIARAIHVVAVVVWVGGVWFVTMVALPNMRRKAPAEWLREFDAVEHRFAPQARIAVVLVLLSGLYMLYDYDLWSRFADGAAFWWMHLMVGVWALFAAVLFALEPLVVGPWIRRAAVRSPESTLTLMIWLHRVLLLLSLAAAFAAAAGAHGLF